MSDSIRESQRKYHQRMKILCEKDPAFREYERLRKNKNKKAENERNKIKRKTDPELDEKLKKRERKGRCKFYNDNKESEKEKMRSHYANNKEYFREKNKEYHIKNGDKWVERKREIAAEYDLERAKGTEINSLLNSLGSFLSVEDNIKLTFKQAFLFVKSLGYTKEDILRYEPFRRKYEHYLKKKIKEIKST